MANLSLRRALCWQRHDGRGAEYAALWRDGAGWQLRGTAVAAIGDLPVNARYGALVDSTWRTRAAHVALRAAAPEAGLHLTVDSGGWSINGTPAPYLSGCADVDLGITPATNTLPIRRLNLAVGESAAVVTAWIQFPSLTVERLEQRYHRIAADRYVYSGAAFEAELLVDDLGLVVAYSDGWTRVAATDAPEEWTEKLE